MHTTPVCVAGDPEESWSSLEGGSQWMSPRIGFKSFRLYHDFQRYTLKYLLVKQSGIYLDPAGGEQGRVEREWGYKWNKISHDLMTGCIFGILQNTKFEKNSRLQSCFILQFPVWPWMRYSLPLKTDSFYLCGFSLGHKWPLMQGPHSRVSPSLSFGLLKEPTAWVFWVVGVGCDWEGLGSVVG